MAPFDEHEFQLNVNRRTFLGRAAYGLGGMALACLLDPNCLEQPVPPQRKSGVES